jgi:ubiquinone biosynthesis protein UbiJ
MSERLGERAKHCRRLAFAAGDSAFALTLNALAREYETLALELGRVTGESKSSRISRAINSFGYDVRQLTYKRRRRLLPRTSSK